MLKSGSWMQNYFKISIAIMKTIFKTIWRKMDTRTKTIWSKVPAVHFRQAKQTNLNQDNYYKTVIVIIKASLTFKNLDLKEFQNRARLKPNQRKSTIPTSSWSMKKRLRTNYLIAWIGIWKVSPRVQKVAKRFKRRYPRLITKEDMARIRMDSWGIVTTFRQHQTILIAHKIKSNKTEIIQNKANMKMTQMVTIAVNFKYIPSSAIRSLQITRILWRVIRASVKTYSMISSM